MADHSWDSKDGSPYSFRHKGVVLTIPEQIADRICEMILDGRYRPGERIMETTLADAFDVSRGPARDALRLLESEGLVTLAPRRGAKVTALNPEEVRNLFEIRAALSSLAAQHAAERVAPTDLESLRTSVAALEALAVRDNTPAYVSQSALAGQIVVAASRNARLQAMLQSLARQTLRYAQLGLSTPERRLESAQFWKTLFERIAAGDAEAAGRINAKMIHRSMEAALSLLE